jgi:hypothetical protein
MLGLQQAAGNRAVSQWLVGHGPGRPGAEPVELRSSPGKPLDRRAGAVLGPMLGSDLDRIRVHSEPQDQDLAERLDARALTVGHDLYFNAGEYQPNTPAGRALLAHELAHARNAEPAGDAPFLTVDRPDSQAERAAEQAAATIADHPAAATMPSPVAAAGPAVHRQPKPGTVRTPTVVVFSAAPTDVEGARRTATRLADRIRTGSMTEDDYEVLRQAVTHFRGRALAAFQGIVQSAIKDRDVLAEVRRQAPAQPEGVPYVPPMLIAPGLKPRSVPDAQRVGKQDADQLRRGAVTKELHDLIEAHFGFFEGKAKEAYRGELAAAVEEVKAKTERQQPGERKLLETRGYTYGEGYGPTARFEQVQTEILPTGKQQAAFGLSFTSIVEIRQQTSDSASVEWYTDVSGSAEASLKIPIKKVFEIKLGGSYKRGRKSAEKHETARVELTSNRFARNYQVDRLEREVIRKTFREVSDETRMIGGGSPALVLVDPVERTLRASQTETQVGYRLTSKEDDSRREVWPAYVGERESETAAQRLWALLEQDAARLAQEVAELRAGGP